MGMTYEQYWYEDPLMVRAFYKANQIRQQRINEEAWLYGAYVYRALDATVGNMMRKKGSQPSEYPQKPIEAETKDPSFETRIEKEQREEQEIVFAKAYMESMVQAGKNWHK